MKIRFAAIFTVVMYLWNIIDGAKIDTLCRKWECQSDIGKGKMGEDRQCTSFQIYPYDGTVGVEAWEPSGYICDSSFMVYRNQTCVSFNPPKWRRDLAPGDSCFSDNECYSQVCQEVKNKRICIGK